MFPDPFIHLGGDEVAPGCWNSDPDITAFMAAHGINSAQELQAWFTKKVLPIVKKYGRRPVYWQEAFESNATKVGLGCWVGAAVSCDPGSARRFVVPLTVVAACSCVHHVRAGRR